MAPLTVRMALAGGSADIPPDTEKKAEGCAEAMARTSSAAPHQECSSTGAVGRTSASASRRWPTALTQWTCGWWEEGCHEDPCNHGAAWHAGRGPDRDLKVSLQTLCPTSTHGSTWADIVRGSSTLIWVFTQIPMN